MRQAEPSITSVAVPPVVTELKQVFDVVDLEPITTRLKAYRPTGRPGWSLQALCRAYLAAAVQGLGTTNALIRWLQDMPEIRRLCGFDEQLPSRWTFNRCFARLAQHVDLVEQATARLSTQLYRILPRFGENVAVDASVVRSWSNPKRAPATDPEASWTAKTGTQGRREWSWGFKLHLAIDATYELPLAHTVTTGSVNDTVEFVPVLQRTVDLHHWFAPAIVTADAGYDSWKNHMHTGRFLHAAPVIKRNRRRGERQYDLSHPSIPYGSDIWDDVYRTHQSVERCFSRLKSHRGLNRHCRRGLGLVTLHCALSVLSLQATALTAMTLGRSPSACARDVA